jgi:hypothetical protein
MAGGLMAKNDTEFVSQSVPQTVEPGQTYAISVTFRNTGTTTWSGSTLHRLGTQDPRDNSNWIPNPRVDLPHDVSPGQNVTFSFNIKAPAEEGIYTLRWQMVQDGVEWFGQLSEPVYYPIILSLPDSLMAKNNSAFVSQSVPQTVEPGQTYAISVTFRNTGTTTWSGSTLHRLGTQDPRDNSNWIPNPRVNLPHDVSPGQNVTFSFNIKAPAKEGIYTLRWQMVQDGVDWFGQLSEPVYYPILLSLPDSLLSNGHRFSVSDPIVSTLMFCWYGLREGQVKGPWVPLDGRDSWNGSVEFWKQMIKQAMAANIDVFYVELIPSYMEQYRFNFLHALYQLRTEGWEVPKVSPFFDTEITYTLLGRKGNLATEEGKDELAGFYINFYKQYYAANPDTHADDFIYTLDNRPVLNIWHVHNKLDNYDQLTRSDLTNRLKAAFGEKHSIFNNDIRMVNNAISPPFSFADERVHQFEVHEYKIEKEHNGIKSSQVKPGYWDQNVRTPGYIMKRDGGSHYKKAWDDVNADNTIDRVYIESFNEYDEGSGIYAAKTDFIFRVEGNTSTDTWSETNDPWEYIKTTAAGAAKFNNYKDRDAKIIWENIPAIMDPGQVYNAKVTVRNTGNELWNNSNGFSFSQHDNETDFGTGKFYIDDSQDEIPIYGGIFRGRTKSFNVQVVAPDVPGKYITNWGMFKEGAGWFGEVLTREIEVRPVTASEICHKLNFKTGWNIYSAPSVPKNPKTELIFNPLIENSSLVKIQDELGNSLEDWGIFGGWKDYIGNVLPSKGYKIKVSKIDSVEICGTPVDFPFAIPLQTGWNIIGYPQTTAFDGSEIIQQLVDRNSLEKVQDEAGNSIEDWGTFGGWQNNIGNFIAGEGYKIKVNKNDTLWIYDIYPKSVALLPGKVPTKHFNPEFEGNGTDHMNVNLVGLPINLLKAGDEIAVFDNENCVGAITIIPYHLKNQKVSIAVSATDNQGKAGFEEGNQFKIKLWNSLNNWEYLLKPDIVKGTSFFAKNETTIASLEKYTISGLEVIPGSTVSEIKCYPNPFNNEINIEINISEDMHVQVELLNQLGQRVRFVANKQLFNAGLHKFTWDGTNAGKQNVSPGIYHLKVIAGEKEYRKKIVYSN